MEKKILDVTCATRSIWFNKNHPLAVYCDKRNESFEKDYPCGNYKYDIRPDVVCDFTDLPFDDDSFPLVVFDPPHIKRENDSVSAIRFRYGCLKNGWETMLRDGFQECMRVLKPDGILILKWSEVDIQTKDLIKAVGQEPLFGHKSGKQMNTHWLCFMKGA